MEPIEYQYGQQAYAEGLPLEANPYRDLELPPEANGSHIAWARGWAAAAKKAPAGDAAWAADTAGSEPRSVDPDPVDVLMEQVSRLTPNQLEDLARRAGALRSKREKGRKFDVRLTAMAHVQARETVYADTAEEAASAALSWAGGVEWTYDGLCEGEDQGPEVSSVEEIQ